MLNDLSLDAPLVAIGWQFIIAESLTVSLQFYHYLVLGFSVWLAYSADRFFDPSQQVAIKPSTRHKIFKKHRIAFLVSWFLLLLMALSISLVYLSLDCFFCGMALFAVCTSNLILCVRENRTGIPSPLFKEFRTASIFTMGLFFFPAFESSWDFTKFSITLSLVFYPIFINCLSVSRWEYANDQRNGSLSFLQKSPKLLAFFLKTSSFVAFALSLILLSGCFGYRQNFLLILVLSILVFVFLLEEISFLVEDDKRKAIDFGYWFIPIFLSGFEYVGLF